MTMQRCSAFEQSSSEVCYSIRLILGSTDDIFCLSEERERFPRNVPSAMDE
jgi:hypothetical protein